MKEIVWFRRDLRVEDSALLHYAKDEVLPIFIFDTNILNQLQSNDRRVSFIYYWVLKLKLNLQRMGLDLAIFYGEPEDIFKRLLQKERFDGVVCSIDFDSYAIKRDRAIEALLPMERYGDSFLLHPQHILKKDGTPYRVFTPFYKSLDFFTSQEQIELLAPNPKLKKIAFDYEHMPTLHDTGFETMALESFLYESPEHIFAQFAPKIAEYKSNRDFFALDGTSKLSVHLRFGVLSVRKLFNLVKAQQGGDFYIRELFWREFYNYLLYHFPHSEFENFNDIDVKWRKSKADFEAWCTGNTGVPIVDASMRYLNRTGLLHNRLRMIVASFLTKNLLIDWREGERYFAQHLLDYEASSNIGSWQWASSTGADSVPYFRIFNPYLQSQKFDSKAQFITQELPHLRHFSPKALHSEGGAMEPIVDIKSSRERALGAFS